ncbi:hypothetical protein F7234_03915 [Pseudomonas putida]|uniref:hypothetical protein n=1 Tax=Pseudomonas putida TaxID=303 RepID=UPI00125F6AC5|nr:hypothetical protein [Pseudomonas putida]KAB5626290.1 hypothetical protein F7234_03915 [Pseudomonas putida]
MKSLIVIAAFAVMAGCSSTKPERQHQETRECMTYRSMMTAPMATDAMERLKVDCERSMAG